MKTGLSKSRLISWRQCPKRLWLEVNRPDLRVITPDLERRFQVGHQVGAIAQDLENNGLLIEHETNLTAALQATREALSQYPARPLFEPAFQHDGLLVRIDLLVPQGAGFQLVEVKSTGSVKEYHIVDAAIQAWVAAQAGVPVDEVCIGHVNTGFVYPGNADYRGLITKAPITEDIAPHLEEVPRWVAGARETLAGEQPAIEAGGHCTDPFECPFLGHCSPAQPEYPVGLLPDRAGKSLARQLLSEGYEDLREVPAERMPTAPLQRVHRITVSGMAEIGPGAAECINALAWPRYYLDFETIAFTVPIWTGTRPFQALPFQWSCHGESNTGELFHREFLDISGEPPMRRFAESLVETLGSSGPILVYSPYEKRILNELANTYPDLAPALLALAGRLVDLLPVTKQHYYHPDMKGSWSIKAVLPTVAPDLDYASLGEVQDGTSAQFAYLELIDPDIENDRKQQLETQLREYCKLDTLALVRLAGFLATGGTRQ